MSAHIPAQRLTVGLGARSYDIVIGDGLLDHAGEHIAPLAKSGRVFVVSDAHVAPLYAGRLEQALAGANVSARTLAVPAGEGTKSFQGLEQLCGQLLEAGAERSDLIAALGGGVVGDLAGLAAGLLKRGMDYVQIPTTLLAQVDSSVGGKTAINTAQGKNLAGLFHQPRLVLADTGVLNTLPARQLRAGYAEILKYGLLGDEAFYNWLERHGGDVLAGDPKARIHAVATSCAAKARIVSADEREEGQRALLNLGHTFGHALEAATGYSDILLHGEAVALGMLRAFELSEELGHCPAGTAERVARHLHTVGLPCSVSDVPLSGASPGALIAHMEHDKKVKGGQIVLILAKAIGQAFVARDVPREAIMGAWQRALAAPAGSYAKSPIHV